MTLRSTRQRRQSKQNRRQSRKNRRQSRRNRRQSRRNRRQSRRMRGGKCVCYTVNEGGTHYQVCYDENDKECHP